MRQELITPERATELLALNHDNRNVSDATVVKYASDMSAGYWRDIGDPIRYSSERLYDGQHRLLAIVRSGVSVCMWVKDDTDDDDMKVIDSGKARSFADTLRFRGVSNGRDVAALVKLLAVLFDDDSLTDHTAPTKLSQTRLDAFYVEHEDMILTAARRGYKVYAQIGVSKSQLGAAFAWLDHLGVDDEISEEFANLVGGDGSNLPVGSPILALRNYGTRIVLNRKKVRRDELFIAVLKTFNAWVEGKSVKQMKVLPSEGTPSVIVL